MLKKMKNWSGIHTRIRITTKSQPLVEGNQLPMSAKFGRRPFSPNFQANVIRDSNPDFRINPDPDVCRMCRTMSWIYYILCISHFAKYRTNWP